MNARPLVWIAGWSFSGSVWLSLKGALDDDAGRVISTAELWRRATDDASARSSGLSRYAAGLRGFLEPYRGPVGVIGWSMGGMVALEMAREYPKLLERLVIISGTARFCAGHDEPPGVSAAVLRAMARGLLRTPDRVLAAFDKEVHAPKDVSQSAAAGRMRDIARLDREELQQGLDYLQRLDVRDGLNRLEVPTLVLHGREDRIVPWQAGEWLSRQLPGGRWRCYEGLGHALPVQAAPQLAADIRAFLA